MSLWTAFAIIVLVEVFIGSLWAALVITREREEAFQKMKEHFDVHPD